MTFAQLAFAFPLDGVQSARNASSAPPAAPVNRTRPGRPCGRCAALRASPTAPEAGVQCIACRLAADRPVRSCAVCAGPLDPGKKSIAKYCSRRCKDRGEVDAAAKRDHAAGIPHERPRCYCARPVLVPDVDLGEARCLLCGRTP